MILTICLGSWIALGILKFFWMSHEFVIDLLKLSISTIFFSFIFSLAARQVLFSGHVDLNKIVGSLSLFLVLGLIWSFLYLIILKLDSDSFSGICLQSQNTDFSNATYFSFVTLTTLGYGDITPRSSLAKLLVYLESAVGIFYMSVVVSSLVGASLNKKQIDI
ncbi:potassium channel family protein [Shewanella sp. FJAT-52076]|uniref:potassium channel family protein n=1 Tax=Shewanella sp. FJAT-52076 TaxID=2864202 RepID=UPI001C657695|nr:potassium channel family protein [Shewanella sp. FJAT-52076]QYJ75327.1 potassium channel family protein [Shewanella sp. FJAT-52076]